jgi:hypothetical protein
MELREAALLLLGHGSTLNGDSSAPMHAAASRENKLGTTESEPYRVLFLQTPLAGLLYLE